MKNKEDACHTLRPKVRERVWKRKYVPFERKHCHQGRDDFQLEKRER